MAAAAAAAAEPVGPPPLVRNVKTKSAAYPPHERRLRDFDPDELLRDTETIAYEKRPVLAYEKRPVPLIDERYWHGGGSGGVRSMRAKVDGAYARHEARAGNPPPAKPKARRMNAGPRGRLSADMSDDSEDDGPDHDERPAHVHASFNIEGGAADAGGGAQGGRCQARLGAPDGGGLSSASMCSGDTSKSKRKSKRKSKSKSGLQLRLRLL